MILETERLLILARGEDEAELGYWIGVPYWGRGSPPKPVGSCSAMPVTGSSATGCAEGCAASL